jgi:fibronectin type 3 domain-containing protein
MVNKLDLGSGTLKKWTVRVIAILIVMTMCIPLQSIASGAGPSDPPTAVRDLTATPGNGSIKLQWTGPEYSNASAISEYRIYRGPSPQNITLLVTLGNVLTYTDPGLVNGNTYHYSIRAMNSAGEGAISGNVSATPRTVPNRPIDPVIIPGNLFLNVTWSAPWFNGGSNITNFNVYRVVSSNYVLIGNVTNRTWYVDAKLTIGSTYTYVITAVNIAGESVHSERTSGSPDMVPGAVRDLQAFSGVRNVTLTWTAPVSNGGSGIIGYKVFRGNETVVQLIAVIDPLTRFVDLGLDDNYTYHYQIIAYNIVGNGEPSHFVYASTFGTPHLTINAVIPGDHSVTLHWYPLDNGGAIVKRYWVYRGLDAASNNLYATLGNVLSYSDLDVENGVSYCYRIAAENDVGVGLSQYVNCTPMTVPGTVVGLDGRSNDHFVALNWTVPLDDGGSPIIAYNVYMGTTASSLRFLGTINDTRYISSGLDISTIYYYQITAVNSAGEGEGSDILAIASGRTPTYPVELIHAEGDSFVQLEWGKPTDEGTTPIQSYTVYRSNGSTLFEPLATVYENSFNDTSVLNKASYIYYVCARNTIGLSDPSNRVFANPQLNGTEPSQPIMLTAEGLNGYILLNWTRPNSDGGQPIRSYVVYRGLTNDSLVMYRSVTTTYFNSTNLPLDTTYFYKVAAVNAIGTGNFSDLVNATTKLPPVPAPKEQFLWGIFESLFFYLGLVMLACVVLVLVFMKRFKKRGFRKKVAQKKGANLKSQLPGQQNGSQPGSMLKKK